MASLGILMNSLAVTMDMRDPGPSSRYYVKPASEDSPYGPYKSFLVPSCSLFKNGPVMPLFRELVADTVRLHSLRLEGDRDEILAAFSSDTDYETLKQEVLLFARIPSIVRIGRQLWHQERCRLIITYCRCIGSHGDAAKLARLANWVHDEPDMLTKTYHLDSILCEYEMPSRDVRCAFEGVAWNHLHQTSIL